MSKLVHGCRLFTKTGIAVDSSVEETALKNDNNYLGSTSTSVIMKFMVIMHPILAAYSSKDDHKAIEEIFMHILSIN